MLLMEVSKPLDDIACSIFNFSIMAARANVKKINKFFRRNPCYDVNGKKRAFRCYYFGTQNIQSGIVCGTKQ